MEVWYNLYNETKEDIMQSIASNIADDVFDKVLYFLNNLPNNEVQIVKNDTNQDWSFLENEIQIGLNSGVCEQSHKEIIEELKQKYA